MRSDCQELDLNGPHRATRSAPRGLCTGMTIAALLALTTVSTVAPAHDLHTPIITIREHANGRLRSSVQIDAKSPHHRELLDLFAKAAAKVDSEKVDRNSYAPHQVIETDTTRFDFRTKTVVISRRKSAKDNWIQTSRARTAPDRDLQAAALKLLPRNPAE